MTPPRQPAPKRAPVIPIAIGVVAVVVAIAVAFTLLGGGDDDIATDGTASGGNGTAALEVAPVSIEGDALPLFEGPDGDAAVGRAAPVLTGTTPEGTAATVADAGEPTLVVFLAHWCPHCQRELPLLVQLAGEGAFDGIRLQAVLTGTRSDAPNYPPSAWLEREGWTGDVLLDDEASSAALEYGLSSYPFLIAIDAGGNVVARSSGELPAEGVRAMVDLARGG